MAASYPTSIKSFTTKTDGTDIMASHVNDLQLEVEALETQLLTIGTWTVAVTGFSADPPNMIGRYSLNGGVCTMFVRMPTNGTSNATTFTVSLPFTAKTITNMVWYGAGFGTDNSVTLTSAAMISIASAATTASIFSSFGGTAWTASGGKRVTFQISYEIA